jgi:hypothetical protein
VWKIIAMKFLRIVLPQPVFLRMETVIYFETLENSYITGHRNPEKTVTDEQLQ